MATTDTTNKLFSTFIDTFVKRQEKLDELGTLVSKINYGTSVAQSFVEAEKAVLASHETNFGSLLVTGARALKIEDEPLLPFVLFELGKTSTNASGLTLLTFQEGLKNAVMSIVRVGGLRYGQGSLLDALIPASETAHDADDLDVALTGAAEAAEKAARQAKHPSMMAVALVLKVVADVFTEGA